MFKASKCCQACNALVSLLASCWAREQMISSERSAWGPPGYLGISFPTSWQCWPFSAPLDVNKLRTYICILHLKVKVHPRMVIRVTAKDRWWDLFCFFQNRCCLCSWVWTSHCWLLIQLDFEGEEPDSDQRSRFLLATRWHDCHLERTWLHPTQSWEGTSSKALGS